MKKIFLAFSLLMAFLTNAQSLPITNLNNIKLSGAVQGTVHDSVLVWRGTGDKAVRWVPASQISGGGSGPGVTPDLPAVLTEGNRTLRFVTSDYNFALSNRTETVVINKSVGSVTAFMYDNVFEVGDELEIYNQNCADFKIMVPDLENATIIYKNESITGDNANWITVPLYSKVYLKCYAIDGFFAVIVTPETATATPNFQDVLTAGYEAVSLPDENSRVSFLLDDTNPNFILNAEGDTGASTILMNKSQMSLTGNSNDAINSIVINDAGLSLQRTIPSLGKSNTVKVAPPTTATTNVTVPAPTANGNYYTGLFINGNPFNSDGDISLSLSGTTNLGYTASPTNGIVTSSTGTSATLPAGSTTNASLMLPADKTKLNGIATGATANSSDAFLLARANHTGTQAFSTITGTATTAQGGTGLNTIGTANQLIRVNAGATALEYYTPTPKVDANAAITGATKTKITYDAKGLVTAGADATTADISDSTNKRYQTDSQNTNNDANSPIQAQINAKFTLPSLTSGSVLFSNGTSITEDNSNFFWDNTNKLLSLGGVSSMGSTFTVASNNTTLPLSAIKSTSTSATNVNAIQFYNASNRYGAIGITSNTSSVANQQATNQVQIGNGNGAGGLILYTVSGDMIFKTGTFPASASTSPMVIKATTNNFLVGTATDNTTDKLQVNGSAFIGTKIGIGQTATADVHIKAATATAGTGQIKLDTSAAAPTTPERGLINHVADNLTFDAGSTAVRYILSKNLTNTATLDFPSTSPGMTSTLTVTVTGAADGDIVKLGVPGTALVANADYQAYVSSANTVTVYYMNMDTVSSQNPGSGTFRVSVEKY